MKKLQSKNHTGRVKPDDDNNNNNKFSENSREKWENTSELHESWLVSVE